MERLCWRWSGWVMEGELRLNEELNKLERPRDDELERAPRDELDERAVRSRARDEIMLTLEVHVNKVILDALGCLNLRVECLML